jgi:hypothetical protein
MDAVLMKVVAAFAPSEIVALVKAVSLAKSDVVAIIRALALRQRRAGVSPAQAFARFITRDPDGITLYRILKSMPGAEITPFNEVRSTSIHARGHVLPRSQQTAGRSLRLPVRRGRSAA